MSFTINLQRAEANINRNFAQARFHGNANVAINEEMNEERLLEHFRGFGNAHGVGGQVRELVALLAATQWHITAGVHRGGLGGAAGGADPRNHITLTTGHHIRFGGNGMIVEITGPGIGAIGGRAANQQVAAATATAAAAAAGGDTPPAGAIVVDWLQNRFNINFHQAVWVNRQYQQGNGTYTTLAARAAREIR